MAGGGAVCTDADLGLRWEPADLSLRLIVAALSALWLRVDNAALHAGLYGFNAFLVGIASTPFLALSPLMSVDVLLGGAVSVVATLAMTTLMRTWGLSALTAIAAGTVFNRPG
jgi:urea transporter